MFEFIFKSNLLSLGPVFAAWPCFKFEFIFKSNPLSLGPVIAAWPCFKRWQAAVKRDGQLELALGILQLMEK